MIEAEAKDNCREAAFLSGSGPSSRGRSENEAARITTDKTTLENDVSITYQSPIDLLILANHG